MALFKCQACGAPLEVRDGTEVAFCPYCGMKQTLPKEPVQVMSDGTSVESLLKRAFMFLEDGEFEKANEYCDRVLDVEPENAKAYCGKFMADMEARNWEELTSKELSQDNKNYRRAIDFGYSPLRDLWYEAACKFMSDGNFLLARTQFKFLSDYRDANDKAKDCLYLEECRASKYKEARTEVEKGNYYIAYNTLISAPGYKATDGQAAEIMDKIIEIALKKYDGDIERCLSFPYRRKKEETLRRIVGTIRMMSKAWGDIIVKSMSNDEIGSVVEKRLQNEKYKAALQEAQ